MKKLALALTATAAFAGQAIAADMPARMPVKAAPMAAPVASWTGCYVGGGGGYGLWYQENTGYFDVYTVGPDGATRTRDVKWFDPNEEDSNYYSQAPYCGP